MVALLIFVGCILAFLVVLFWYGLRGESNQDPAIGTNRPYPDGLGPTGPARTLPPYLPTSRSARRRRSAATQIDA